MSKINFFNADRALSVRVSDFVRCQIWAGTLKQRASIEIKKHEQGISGAENLRGSIISDDQINAMVAAHTAEILKIRKNLKAALEAEASWKWDDADNAFFKAWSKASTKALEYKALQEWFKVKGGLDVDDYRQMDEYFAAMGGLRLNSFRGIVESDGTQWTKKRTKADVLKVFYALLAEKMIAAGTISKGQIPEDMAEYYAAIKEKKAKAKEERKAAAEAAKKN